MRISGWLPVSYSVYKMLEKQAYDEWIIWNQDDVFYIALKFITDYLNDNPKETDRKLISKINKILGEYGQVTWRDDQVKIWIDFIRDSLIIYQDTIHEERNPVKMGR